MYLKHGAYYFVNSHNKWIKLGNSLSIAMQEWSKLFESDTKLTSMSHLFDRYMIEVIPKKAIKTSKENFKQIENLRKSFGHMQPNSITPVHVYSYLDLRGQTAPISANREKALLSHIYTMAIRWGIVLDNPCKNVKRITEKHRDRYITDEEFKAVRNIAPSFLQNVMDFAYITGLRQADILDLSKSNITQDGISVVISKTKSKILIEWSDELKNIVTNCIKERDNQYLFCNMKGNKYTSDGFRTMWTKLINRAYKIGIIEQKFRFHDIRRKTATDLEQIYSREHARKLLGHKDQSTTAVYIGGAQKVRPLK